jgi:L-aspartate oxidase
MAETARLMTVCALAREESRGGHYRSDFPELAGEARRSLVTLSAAQVLSARALGY